MSAIETFLASVRATYKSGAATEHSYRPALQILFESLDDKIHALNEPKRVACGAPDFILSRGAVAVGHVEAKDIGLDLRKMNPANTDQKARYLKALPNLIYTNCLDFDFYREGELVASISIGDYLMGIQPRPEKFGELEDLLRSFLAQRLQTITSTRKLAEMMAGKAVLIKAVLGNTLKADPDLQTELSGQYAAFKEHLIHDITPDEFSDIYAETIAYGMFAARLHDNTVETFTRGEALELLPKSNPFLRSLFSYIAGPDLDDRIRWIIDELAEVFQACDLRALMEDFGKMTGRNDPFLHFYEVFLAAYNPAKRKARGVWYTPEPVVNFIVRAVDEVLQTEFGLPLGLADTSKVSIDWDTGQKDKKGLPLYNRKDVHRVQILDPATGTGTFLAEVIKQIAPRIKGVAEGMWSSYIEKDLIPRLHGFELLMASYAMCHMKLDMVLTAMGYKPSGTPPRLSVYLTNSLEEGEPANQTLPFAQWLSNEVKQANTIKRDMPIMCVIGNPPYSGVSQNMGDWIVNLIDDYKYVDGEHFAERKHWLHDDYVKFMRLSEKMIEKNGEGILGFITNHGYLDNPTFRGMRWHLLKTFEKIYILDLHGNAKKQEVSFTGDQNVFDIQQGVSIIVAVKTSTSSADLGSVFYGDLRGSRTFKNDFLATNRIFSATKKIECFGPQYAFRPTSGEGSYSYGLGFEIRKLMPENVTGIVTMGDSFAIARDQSELKTRLDTFFASENDAAALTRHYGLGKNYAGWIEGNKLALSKATLKPVPIAYRPFDTRWTIFDNRILWRWREKVMKNMLDGENISLAYCRQSAISTWSNVFVSSFIGDDSFVSNRTKERAYFSPLYIYPRESDLDQTRRVNFDPTIYQEIRDLARDESHGEPDEVAVFDYIYGVLHCPAYRDTYAEFLKTDFPRIPWPKAPDSFWQVSEAGAQLRRLHLMEPGAIGSTPYPFKGHGDNVVENPIRDELGSVWINKEQFFEGVSETAWEFHIGGYKPAQKWLKDRKGRTLNFDDVVHYQRIIKILNETDRIMQTIEMDLS